MYSATVACIYNVDGKCKGMLTPEPLNILQKAFDMSDQIAVTAKYKTQHIY
jgi:hypothetical protein